MGKGHKQCEKSKVQQECIIDLVSNSIRNLGYTVRNILSLNMEVWWRSGSEFKMDLKT